MKEGREKEMTERGKIKRTLNDQRNETRKNKEEINQNVIKKGQEEEGGSERYKV